jgi:proton-translocating NADH-quinone oxidoreductase chain N
VPPAETVLFHVSDIPRILPEILLLVLAILVLASDVFERWDTDEQGQRERNRASALLTIIGLGLIFFIVLVQSGFLYRLPADAPANFFTNILGNLQGGLNAFSPVAGAFATDHLTMISRLIFIAAAMLTAIITIDHRPENQPAEFYALILFSTLGMCLMAGSTELILAYLGVEMTSIPLYVLAGYFQKDTKTSSEAGMKYFLFGALSSAILLYGMSLVYGYTASTVAAGQGAEANTLTRFAIIAQNITTSDSSSPLLMLGMLFIIGGIGYKIAVVPFHGWSPDVYQGASTPMTGFISTASKAAGFLLLYRMLISTFPALTGSASLAGPFGGWTSILAILAIATLVIGNLAALPQTNAKRLLAYSSIAQAGFVLMGLIAWAAPLASDRAMGASSLLYYLIVYTFTNLGAFGALAVVSMNLGGDDMEHLDGLAQRNLLLAVLLAICVLSLAGIPPLAGFMAKFYVFMAAWQSGAWWLVISGVFTTIISLYYYLRMLKAMFIHAPNSPDPVSVPRAMNVSIVIATLLVMALGIYPNMVLTTIDQAATIAGL